MQRLRHVMPIENAFLARDDGQNLFRFLPDQIGVAPSRLRVQPGPRNAKAPPLHLCGVNAHMLGRRDLQSPLVVRAVVNPDIQLRTRQMRIGDLLPGLPDIAKLHLRGRQVARKQPFVLPFDRRLVAEAVWSDGPDGHHQMRMVVANIGLLTRRMDGEVHRRAVAFGQPLRELACRRQSLLGCQLMRQRDLELPRDAGVFAVLRPLRRVPQSRSIQGPGRLDALGNDDLGMLDAGSPGKVMGQAIALVGETFGGAIGGGGDRAAARRAADRLHAEMVDRQIDRRFCRRRSSAELRSNS